MVLLAEARIGAELAKAQERGEVAARADNLKRGSEVRSADIGKATLPEIGIPRQRASEMKKLAQAGEGAIRAEAITARLGPVPPPPSPRPSDPPAPRHHQ